MIIFLLSAAVVSAAPKSSAQVQYEALAPVAVLNYRTCLTVKAAAYAKTAEPVGTVVDAAFGACTEDRNTLSALPKKVGLNISPDLNERQLSWMDEQERKRLTAFILDLRSK